jgi:hypothetical protein
MGAARRRSPVHAAQCQQIRMTSRSTITVICSRERRAMETSFSKIDHQLHGRREFTVIQHRAPNQGG